MERPSPHFTSQTAPDLVTTEAIDGHLNTVEPVGALNFHLSRTRRAGATWGSIFGYLLEFTDEKPVSAFRSRET